ncbi:MAG: CRISPR-associated helicase Cas3' [Acidimicrobiales bacterium]
MTFDDFFALALGESDARPFPHQRVLAEEGLPTVFTAPTGSGKTEAAVLGHLYRRYQREEDVQTQTPRWLVLALPTRGLVEQTVMRVRRWVANLGLATHVYTVMGGESWDDRAWRMAPRDDAVFIGTVDMLLSRALNRGYADSRWSWPISFGLFNNGTQWVFDEVQQMELAAVNSRQLQAFRDTMGTILPTRSMWMSATLDRALLETVDAPAIDRHVDALALDGASDELLRRVDATKTVRELPVTDRKKPERSLAAHALERHRAGTLSLVVCNTVERAQHVYSAVEALDGSQETVLLHRRFRPPERRDHTESALAPVDASGPGRIVVSTQVLEAGVDVDAATMITELAPWPSIVQRAGRCNRAGRVDAAELWWVDLDDRDALPYEQSDLDGARITLRELEGSTVSPRTLGDLGPPPQRRVHHVLRRRDLVELFDTSPDLSGDPLDVSQFIRDGDERDVHVAWRAEPEPSMPSPDTDELCPVSIGEFRKWLAGSDHRPLAVDPRASSGVWQPARAGDVRPGQVVVVDVARGGYDPAIGWSRRNKVPVVPVEAETEATGFGDDESLEAEPASTIGIWYGLSDHLVDVDRVASEIVDVLAPDLTDDLRSACVAAAALHDLGKAHEVWQGAAREAGGEDSPAPPGLVAKTPGRGRLRFAQPHFRHELASLVALRGHAAGLLDGLVEADLCCYLVAAHHGRVRLSVRSVPGERSRDGRPVMLGVVDGSPLPTVETPSGTSPEGALELVETAAAWTRAAVALRDRSDLGPFRVAFLEAVVRLADWGASRMIVGGETA